MVQRKEDKNITWKHEPQGVQAEPWISSLNSPRKCPRLTLTGNVNNINIIPYMLSHQVENQSIGLRTLFELICELDICR